MYADKITDSMSYAIKETNRRRQIQNEYNVNNNITPKTIYKDIRDSLVVTQIESVEKNNINMENLANMSNLEKKNLIAKLEKEMKEAAKALNFESAMAIRDIIYEIKSGM